MKTETQGKRKHSCQKQKTPTEIHLKKKVLEIKNNNKKKETELKDRQKEEKDS